MPAVASFGSVNVDRVATVDAATVADLTATYEWFPAAGETVRAPVGGPPAALGRHVDRTLLGGKGANQAVAAARAGADAALFGCIGADRTERVRDALTGRGVACKALSVVDAPTGCAHVFVTPDAENRIVVSAGANGRVDPAYAHAHLDRLRAADALLLQNEVPVAAAEALLLALDGDGRRPTVLLDPAPTEGVADLLVHSSIDVLVPNERERAALADEGALDAFDGTVVTTRGPAPVEVDAPDGPFTVAPPPADPVDTTGAGDVFAGYLATELAEGAPLRSAVELAAAAAARSTEREGVQRATPDRTGLGVGSGR